MRRTALVTVHTLLSAIAVLMVTIQLLLGDGMRGALSGLAGGWFRSLYLAAALLWLPFSSVIPVHVP
jgi:hypothetical protein